MNCGQIVFEIRPRADRRSVDLISEALPFGKLWYDDAIPAASYAGFYSRSKRIEIRFFDGNGQLIETRTRVGDFIEP